MKSDRIIPDNGAGTKGGELEFQLLAERAAELEEENLRLEETLRRNSRVFRELLIAGEAGITLTGPDRRIVRVIKGVTGIDPETLVGQPIDATVAPEDRETVVEAYRQLLEGRRGKVRIVVRVRNSEGNIALYDATLTDMLENPDIQGIVCNYSKVPVLEDEG
jgi:PAS domain S-box-containing protein